MPTPISPHLRRAAATTAALLLVALALAGISSPIAAATTQAVGVPVVVDGFGNPNIPQPSFLRWIVPLPLPHTSTTPQGVFSQANSVGTMDMVGTGNGTSGTTLVYKPPTGSIDLSSLGSNGQILIDFAMIDQQPAPGQWATGVTTYMTATDANGNVATSPSDAVGNLYAFNAAFPFAGFDGNVDFSKITELDISFVYPATHTGGGTLRVQVNKIWATPVSGAQPSPPTPTVTAPATAATVTGSAVNFTVSFASSDGAAPVTYSPPSNIGVRPQDLAVSGSAFAGATPNITVSGGPSTYTVGVSGMTQTGQITVHVPAGIVDDAWTQLSNASANDPTTAYTLLVVPKFQSAATATLAVGSPASFTVNAMGGSPAPFPIPALSIASGTPPAGLVFHDNGDGTASINGTPAVGAGGAVTLTLQAASLAGTVKQNLTLTVNEAPTITSAAAATFTVGTTGSFSVTTGHAYPTPTVSIGTVVLPAGLSFRDNGNGTATIAGKPAAGTGRRFSFPIVANNGTNPAAIQTLTLTINEAPTITSATAATFIVGTTGSFTITTGHDYPTATTVSIGTVVLPAGLSFHDNGNGTATISGKPAAGTGRRFSFPIVANNGTNPAAIQTLTLTINEAPTITSTATATFTVGTTGSFSVTTGHGYPTPTLSVGTVVLPAGLSFHDNGNGTATLAGKPATGTGGTITLTLTATNLGGTVKQNLTLTINEVPTITSATAATFIVGTTGSFTITTGHDYPTATTVSIGTVVLPAGLSFHDNGNGTATITGKPVAGTGRRFSFPIVASNGVNPAAIQTLTLTINEAPTITSATAATFTVGTTSSFTITTGHGYPTATALSIGTVVLPTGLSFHDNGNGTATITGKPATGTKGKYTLAITASNGSGTNTAQSFELTVE